MMRLEIVLITACHDHVVNFQHHSAQLRRKQELLSLRDQRVDDEVFSHVCKSEDQ